MAFAETFSSVEKYYTTKIIKTFDFPHLLSQIIPQGCKLLHPCLANPGSEGSLCPQNQEVLKMYDSTEEKAPPPKTNSLSYRGASSYSSDSSMRLASSTAVVSSEARYICVVASESWPMPSLITERGT